MRFVIALLILIVSASGALGQSAPGKDVAAKVGDQEITREMVENIINTIPEENRVPFLTPDGRKKILDDIVQTALFAEAARKKGMDKEPAVQTRLDYVQTEYLAREFFRRHLADLPDISESDLESYYKSHLSEFKPPEEVQARHILVGTEAEANKIMQALKDGTDFAELAKKKSMDPAAANGGKLEAMGGGVWLPKGTFEKSFEFALFKLGKGEIGGPIKTQFGWHIIKVDDKRQPEMPAFVQVRSMIKNRLMEERIGKLRAELLDQLKNTIPVTYK